MPNFTALKVPLFGWQGHIDLYQQKNASGDKPLRHLNLEARPRVELG